MAYEVRISKKAGASLNRLSDSGLKKDVSRILRGIEGLSEEPYRARPGVDILQLESVDPKLFRLRVGKYRILYSIDGKNKVVYVTIILHRKKAYRRGI